VWHCHTFSFVLKEDEEDEDIDHTAHTLSILDEK